MKERNRRYRGGSNEVPANFLNCARGDVTAAGPRCLESGRCNSGQTSLNTIPSAPSYFQNVLRPMLLFFRPEGKKGGGRKPVQVFKNCRLNCRFAFPFFLPLPLPLSLSSLFLFQRQIRYNVNASVARSITKQISIPLIHGLNRNLFFFFPFFIRERKHRMEKSGDPTSVVERYERGAGCGRRAVSVKTQIVSWKEDAATWLILLARVPAPLDLQDLSISGSCLGPASSVVTVVRNSNWTHYRA